MNEIEQDFKYLRVNLRKRGKIIAEDVFKRVHPSMPKKTKEICVFCNSSTKLTKEHVLPQWLFESNINRSMISGINKQTQTYYKAVIPACETCNNETLSNIEKSIIKIINRIELNDSHTFEYLSDIIRWLEILDYKLQVYECRRRYIKYGNDIYDKDWGEFSIAMLRHFYEMNPFKAYNFLRQSQNRITIKIKQDRLSSLLLFNTQKAEFSFFNLVNEYIFISFPMFKIAIFYFFKRSFESKEEALNEAYKIIDKVFKEE